MKLLKAVVELRYSEPAHQFLFLDAVARELIPEPQEQKVIVGGNFEIGLKNDRTVVVVEPQRVAIIVEKPITKVELSTHMEEMLKKVYSKLSYTHKVTRIGFRAHWAIEKNGTFEELLKNFKEKYFSSVPLIQHAQDVGIPLNFKFDSKHVNFNSGPMKKSQYVQTISQFKDGADVPELFCFADVDYYKMPNVEMKKKEICAFVEEGFDYGEATSVEFFHKLI